MAICFGEYLAVYGNEFVFSLWNPAKTLMWMQWLIWSQVIVWFYARDLWLSFHRATETTLEAGQR